ncbi:MAG: DUF2007 domain-containing protein [Pseudomonadota bacterium]
MKELLRSNDPVLLSFVESLMAGEGIAFHQLDLHTSMVEGSIGALPRRIMVRKEDLGRAQAVLRDVGVLPEAASRDD